MMLLGKPKNKTDSFWTDENVVIFVQSEKQVQLRYFIIEDIQENPKIVFISLHVGLNVH